MKSYFSTEKGKLFLGKAEQVINDQLLNEYKEKVQLILTSPPFPLNQKKKYGNLQGDEYKIWFQELAELFSPLLKNDGSIVIELGNSWEPKRPVQSLLHLEALLAFVKNPKTDFRLCQEFICHNPSRLPSPAQWVTIERIRMVDSYTHIWWISKTDKPKADNNKVLRPYSDSMKKLLKSKQYNHGKRPSEHQIGEESFLEDNGGSIMQNVIELESVDPSKKPRLPKNVLSHSNTVSNDFYHRKLREKEITPHPARMAKGLATFFIQFLTDENDIVFDPFAGSNTTGYCAEKLNRNWIAVEAEKDYADQSKIRFQDPQLNLNT